MRNSLLRRELRFAADHFPCDLTIAEESVITAVTTTLKSGAWSMFTSQAVAKFEQEFSEFVGAKHCVFVTSCTAAIHASLVALGVHSGCKVGFPAYTYIGTCLPALAMGCKPVFFDVQGDSPILAIDQLIAAFNKEDIDAAVVPLLFGMPIPRQNLEELKGIRGHRIVFDCAQFLGDKRVTEELVQLGPCCFSFGESKQLKVGEGGMIATNSAQIARVLREFRHAGEIWRRHDTADVEWHEIHPRDVLDGLVASRPGMNLRPLAISAAIGSAKLAHLPQALADAREKAEVYSSVLRSSPHIELPRNVSTWWTFPCVVKSGPIDRNTLLAMLLYMRVPVGLHFPALLPAHPVMPRHPTLRPKYEPAGNFARNHLVLPLYGTLTKSHVSQIAETLVSLLDEAHDDLPSLHVWANEFLSTTPLKGLNAGLFISV